MIPYLDSLPGEHHPGIPTHSCTDLPKLPWDQPKSSFNRSPPTCTVETNQPIGPHTQDWGSPLATQIGRFSFLFTTSLRMRSGPFRNMLNAAKPFARRKNHRVFGIIHWELLAWNQTVTTEVYCAQQEHFMAMLKLVHPFLGNRDKNVQLHQSDVYF